jgi:hypothetical protein
MKNWTVDITDADIEAALEEASKRPPRPVAVCAEYVGGDADLVVIRLDKGGRLAIPREYLQGLENATEAQLKEIEIHSGVDIAWPQLDVDHYLPYLLEHRYGNKKWMESLRSTGVFAQVAEQVAA